MKCPDCNGTGSAYPEESDEALFNLPCDTCHGSGEIDNDFDIVMETFNIIGIPYEFVEWEAGKAITLKSVNGDGELDIYFFSNGKFNEIREEDKTDWGEK